MDQDVGEGEGGNTIVVLEAICIHHVSVSLFLVRTTISFKAQQKAQLSFCKVLPHQSLISWVR